MNKINGSHILLRAIEYASLKATKSMDSSEVINYHRAIALMHGVLLDISVEEKMEQLSGEVSQ